MAVPPAAASCSAMRPPVKDYIESCTVTGGSPPNNNMSLAGCALESNPCRYLECSHVHRSMESLRLLTVDLSGVQVLT